LKRSADRKALTRIGILLPVLLTVLFFASCATQKNVIIVYQSAPALVDGTRPEMNTSGFWIGRDPDPDEVIADQDRITYLNALIKEKTRAVYDVLAFRPFRDGKRYRESFRSNLKYITAQGYFMDDGRKVSGDFLKRMEAVMDIGSIPAEIPVRWGLTVARCNQRLLPTTEPLFRNPTDKRIDRLQNNSLDLAVPLVVLHESSDRKWVYVIAPFSDGWLEAESVATCTLDELARFAEHPDFIVATEAKADLFRDPMLRQHLSYIQMGVRLPLFRDWDKGTAQVMIPVRGEDGRCLFDAAYVSYAQVHRGYLTYTPRHALEQAFKLLNAPYGWGGMYGEQDCSRFIQEVFASMGIMLPRNSGMQGTVGKIVATFSGKSTDKYRLGMLADARGGVTLLQFPGHVMLYLGMIDGRPYAIHDLFAYTEKDKDSERLVSVNRTAVTSLDLGIGTKRGSLLERLTNVRLIAP
jgi:hypothetical protein